MVAVGDSSLADNGQPTVVKAGLKGRANSSDEDRSCTRYAILCATIICLSSVMANIICFNFTVLCMPATHEQLSINETAYHGYAKNERTWLFSAVAVGALISVVPTSHAIATIGARYVFFAAGMLTTVATALIPIAAHNSIFLFLLLRFLQGVACAACMPTVGAVTAAWASLKQHGLFMSTLTTFGQISAIFAMPVSGELCSSSLGWESVFYLHSLICVVAFVGWFFLYTNSPEHHPMVSKHELTEINDGKFAASLRAEEEKVPIPYLEILTTPSVWGVWIGALGDLIAVQLIHTFSPMYIREVLQYSVHHAGFAAALPVLFQFFVKVSLLLPTGSAEEWRTVYLAHAALLVLSNAVFCWLATAKPAPWTDPSSITNPSKKNTPMISRLRV
ncbi:Membrane transporter [Trichostrongylus colubriformis]|uniref:Membrane transporter n=1 Tax=Trichostrongylus colubriformis TaxID=6319 RepID=A0AAN8G173_TRICO